MSSRAGSSNRGASSGGSIRAGSMRTRSRQAPSQRAVPSRGPTSRRTSTAWTVAALVLLIVVAFGCSSESTRPDVLLVTIDTLRPDFLEPYGFEQPSSPVIAGLAEEGVVFDNAIAAGSLTAPAHGSIMTGRFARQHSIGALNGETRLEGAPTLAEQFAGAGYDTAAFISNVVLRRRLGLDRGFGVYDDDLPEQELNRPLYFERTADETAARALEWLASRGDEPVFLWLHLQDPHGPYTPPEETRGRFEDVPLRVKQRLQVLDKNSGRAGIPAYQALPGVDRPGEYAARYAEEVLFADRWLGEVLEAVRARRPGVPPIVVLTADHGESMGEQGWFFQHGQASTPDLARVPLLAVVPGVEPRRDASFVSHADLAPTILELAGLSALEGATGDSLADLIRSGDTLGERVIFCDTDGESAAYFEGGIVRAQGGAAHAVPGSASGPTRFTGLREKEPGVWRPMPVEETAREALTTYLGAAVPLVPAGAMEPEHIEHLRALGYLDPALDPDLDPDSDEGQAEAEADETHDGGAEAR